MTLPAEDMSADAGNRSTPLLKTLTESGNGPRRRMADAIRQGRVEVNGSVVDDFRFLVDIHEDRISIDGQVVDLGPSRMVYLVLNKPKGVLSTWGDDRRRRSVRAILPKKYRHLRLYPAGRLDKDSTGLLLLTNDGELTYRLTHPRYEHEKEYLVLVGSRLKPGEKRRLEEGIRLEDGVTRPATIREMRGLPDYTYSVTIHEGKKRQVRRMFQGLGHNALALKRVRIGGLSLGDLKEGEARELGKREVRVLLGNGQLR